MPSIAKTVAASSDDAYEAQNESDYNHADTALPFSGHTAQAKSRYDTGMRFTGIQMFRGDQVDTATCDLYIKFTDDPCCYLRCEAADDTVTFSSANTPFDRAVTTANTTWNETNIGTEAAYTTPDFASALQEVVDRSGWAYGNDICVIAEGADLATQTCFCASWDHSDPAPDLDITYTEGGKGHLLHGIEQGGVMGQHNTCGTMHQIEECVRTSEPG